MSFHQDVFHQQKIMLDNYQQRGLRDKDKQLLNMIKFMLSRILLRMEQLVELGVLVLKEILLIMVVVDYILVEILD